MTIPYKNGTLMIVRPHGTSDDFDGPGVNASPRWTGSLGVYVAEELLESATPGRVDLIVKTRVEIPYAVGRLVQNGDELVFTDEEGDAQTRNAASIIHARLVGRVRVILEDV